ncbi:MAG: cytochrome d ubiquinol oxidase subunit II [Balneolaceae bacterium]|nr:cytochrome d ubiquinol oxidase subunit II [Balneolaceae bacterium]
MLVDIAVTLLSVILVLYTLFGGTMLGTGIIDLFTGTVEKGMLRRGFSKIWLLNQFWLMVIILVLYVSFPRIFSAIIAAVFIPMAILVLSLILHANSFNYLRLFPGGAGGGKLVRWIFRVSSILSLLCLGLIVGAAISGQITQGTDAAVIKPWFNLFVLCVGIFILFLFSFLASVYMMGELQENSDRKGMVNIAKILTVLTVITGIFVFVSGEVSDLFLLSRFIYSPVAIGSVILSAAALPWLWISLSRGNKWQSRFWAFLELVLVLFAWFDVQNPVVVALEKAPDLTFQNSAAGQPGLVTGIGIMVLSLAAAAGMLVYRRSRS